MSKDDWVYIEHMLEMSLTHLVQVIGEAAQRISPGIRQQYPEIPWREIAGMRNRIVHDYLNVDEDVIWEVVRQDLPDLVVSLEKLAR